MSLERIGATDILAERLHHLGGATLDLGVGGHVQSAPAPGTPTRRVVTLDVAIGHGPDVAGDAHALPFADATFDTVVASQVFEHLHDPPRAAAELARVLAPGGTAVVAVPFLYQLHELPHDYFRYTASGIEALFTDAGLRVEDVVGYGNRFTVAWDLLLASTPGSSVPRRALRRVRKEVLPPKRTTPRPVVARALRRFHQPEFPNGYVAVVVREP